VALITAAVAAGCGTSTPASGSRTLHIAFSSDQGSLDPDIFYGSEGLQATTSCYEGLVRYADNSTTIEPWLAQSYSISPDGKTYTFHLRPHVSFVDGSPLTSSVLRFDIARRAAVNGGPAYMVTKVAAVDAPDPLTLVVHLSQPVEPFLNELASPYGLKAISENAVKAHATTNDRWAKSWLGDHCAGTGPYTLAHVTVNQSYTMKRYPAYWGRAPYYTTLQITQMPNFATQQLALSSGALDLMADGVTPNRFKQFEKDSSLHTAVLPSIDFAQLWIDSHKPPFTSASVRVAASEAINRQQILSEIFPGLGTVPQSLDYPATLPSQYGGAYTTPYDPAAARAVVSRLPASAREITVQYTTDEITNAQVAAIIAAQLSAVGFNATSQGIPFSVSLGLHTAPESKRPNMLYVAGNPDDADPSSGPTVVWSSGPQLGGYLSPYSSAADRVLTAGAAAPTRQAALKLYGQAMTMYARLHVFIPVANLDMWVVARKGLVGLASQRQGSNTLDIAALHAG
jgi:peptide/nickel transport system substrate-binding protein